MNKKNFLRGSLVCLCLLMICGCASFSRRAAERAPVQSESEQEAQLNTLRLSVEKYRSLALVFEKDHQYYKAAFLWLVVQRLKPEDRQALHKITVLEERIRGGADRHLLHAGEHSKRSAYPSARSDYLMALAYDPNCQDALEWVKKHPSSDGYVFYETKQGDTLKSAAQSVYSDPGKDFIVAFFSGQKDEQNFKPGTILKLPVIEAVLLQPEHREYKEHKSRPSSTPAPQLRPLRGYDKAAAENHYRRGMSFFIVEDLPRAIKEWEETLSLDPDHPNARRNIDRARKLLRNGRGK